VLGSTFWAYYSERRIEISKGRLFVPIAEFIELHINHKLKDAVLSKNIGLGSDPRHALGYVPDPDGAPAVGLHKFNGKLSNCATEILSATGSMARRKGTEVAKIDAATRRARSDRKKSITEDKFVGTSGHSDNGDLTHSAIAELGAPLTTATAQATRAFR